MKRTIFGLALMMGTAVLLSSCASRDHTQGQAQNNYGASAVSGPANTWPVRFNNNGTDFTIFEPQCDSWDGHQLNARCAVAIQGPHEPEANFGVFTFSAITLVDKTAQTATLANFQITSADFPTAPNQVQKQVYRETLTQDFPKYAPPMALDNLETAMAAPAPPKVDHLNNTPPQIVIATQPAALVYVDGSPAWRPVPGTDLQQLINTRMLLLKDPAGKYYLHLYDGYLQAPSLDGPWTLAPQPPAGVAVAEQRAASSGQVDLMPGTPDPTTQKVPTLSTAPVPEIIVATKPTELIQFKGEPQYAAIPGTDLLYAVNTSGDVFKTLRDQKNYVLISGRWYRSASLKGPWKFVPGSRLPHSFASIPDNSPKENVKASVPGTQQAEESLIANSIPQSTAVMRTNQMATPQFDGAMQLAPIEGTPLQYIVNSPTPIIEVGPQSWYACDNGVWYAATAATGPWIVAASVPAVIYSIPPDSPLHYLTYVQVYGASPEMVYEGYTPGYMGTEVADDGTVVYGTGYDYDPWIGTVWYGPPVTWGWGFDDCWNPWWGWGFGCGFGWGWGGCFPPRPWWGGFGHWHDHDGDGWWHGGERGAWANANANVYHGNRQFAANRFNAFGPRGSVNGFGQAYNSRTGGLQAGQQAHVRNVSGAAWQRNYAFDNPAGRDANGWNGNYIGPRFGDLNRGYRTYPRGSWYGGNRWSAPANPGNIFQRGAAPGSRHGVSIGVLGGPSGGDGRGGYHGGGGGSFHGGGGGGFHGGGGGGFHGGGGGGHR